MPEQNSAEFVRQGFDRLLSDLIELQENTTYRSAQLPREAKLAELTKLVYELKSTIFGAEPEPIS